VKLYIIIKGMDLKPIDADWYGASAPGNPRWGLEIKGGYLTLRGVCSAPPLCIAEDREGAFVEKLWEGDVIELFLLNPQTGFYVEFNLGPRGGWWYCAFNSPRKRAALPERLSGVIARAAPSGTACSIANGAFRDAVPQAWDSSLTVPLTSLPPALSFDTEAPMGNITFCLGRPQQFISLADLGGGTPDFHRPDKWIALKELR